MSYASLLVLSCVGQIDLTDELEINDVTDFVRSSGLTGRRFLRLREKDLLEEYGINIAWAKIMAEARERLRIECLRGKILGFGGANEDADELASPDKPSSLAVPEAKSIDGKLSWRRNHKPSGRTKGIAALFDRPNHERSITERSSEGADDEASVKPVDETAAESDVESEAESETSLISIEDAEQPAVDWSAIEPIEPDSLESQTPDTSLESSKVDMPPTPEGYRSRIEAHEQSYFAIRRNSIMRPPAIDISSSGDDEGPVGNPFLEDRPDGTIKRVEAVEQQPELNSLFAAAEQASQGLELASIKSRDGSVVVVKKRELAELQRRMDEMEVRASVQLR